MSEAARELAVDAQLCEARLQMLARATRRSGRVARHKAKKRLHAEIFGDSDSDCPESASSASDDSD